MFINSPALSEALSNPANQVDLGTTQDTIIKKIAKSSYLSLTPRIFEVHYDFNVAQIFTVRFYYDFYKQRIQCTIDKELVSSDDINPSTKIIEKLKKNVENPEFTQKNCVFKVVDWIKRNDGYFFFASQSLGKLELHCNASADPKLKEVMQTALTILNEKR